MSWKETDVLQLWKNSTLVPQQGNPDEDIKEKSSVGYRLAGSRSRLWESVTEMSPNDRRMYINRLVLGWPFKWEKRALLSPLYITGLASFTTSTIITAKINGDIHMCNPKMRVLDALRKCPVTPVIASIYTCGLTHYFLYNRLVYDPLMSTDERPCTSCVLTNLSITSLVSGVIVPTLASPHLSYFMLMKMSQKSVLGTNHIDMITLSYEYSRSVWRRLPLLMAAQIGVSAVACYSLLWGRSRIFDTIDVDPELVRKCVADEKENEKTRWSHRLQNYLNQYWIFKRQIGSPVLKTSDDKGSWI